MKLVEDDLTIRCRHVCPYGIDVRVPHVHGDGLDATDLLRGQGLPESVQAALLAVRGHVEHSPPHQIIHQGEIALTFSKGLFIDAKLADGLRFTAFQATLHRPLHDGVNLVPT
jgi:hypothetical protein